MQRFAGRPPAIGQVVVMPFQEARPYPFSSLQELERNDTVLIIKSNAKWGTPYFKFCGGMLEEGQTFEQAVITELRDETGVIGDPAQLLQLDSVAKPQHPPHNGHFEVRFYAAFGCNFKQIIDPLYRETGDEGEEPMVVPLSEVLVSGYQWAIPTKPSVSASLFGPHIQTLQRIEEKLAAQNTA